MNARAEILSRIRRATLDAPPRPAIKRDYATAGQTSLDDHALQVFIDRIHEYRGTVVRSDRAELAYVLGRQLAHRGVSTVVIPDGFPADWLSGLASSVRTFHPPLSAAELDGMDAVVSTVCCAIALTGTVVLDHGAGQGKRAMTLIPDYLLVVVEASQIVTSVPDAIAVLGPRPLMTWVSGPSATSDIELQRVEGVHGPRTLDVVVVDGQG